jgi:NADPH:quinone reductase-like Zn-dependent oxidoreductase
MKAAVVPEYGTVRVGDVDIDEPGRRDVLVRVRWQRSTWKRSKGRWDDVH